jgi:beta-N-acetylhexosaminidase
VECVEEAYKHLEHVPAHELERALSQVARFKAKLAPPDEWTEAEFLRRDAAVRQLRSDTLGVAAADEQSPENGKRSPVEVY